MKLFFIGLLFLNFLVFSRIEHVKAAEQVGLSEQPISFVLSDENIAVWEEVEHGFSIKLTEKARLEFFNLTRENVRKRLNVYVENFLVSSPNVNEPIDSGGMLLVVDNETKDKVRPLLPAAKNKVE